MPAGEVDWLPRDELLTFEEHARVARICVQMGVEKIRLTGGEPLARRDLERLVAMLAAIPNLRGLSMTTNGYYLPQKARLLREAGLRSVNISLDSLRRDRFAELTRRDYFDRVLAGIEAAAQAGFSPIKINCVVMRGINDDEIVEFARWGARTGFVVRFIEFMPLDGDRRWSRERVVSSDEILQRLQELGPIEPLHNDPSDPAREYRLANGAVVGIIPTVSQPFCQHCDRIRLTAEGKIRNCLFAHREFDVKELVRGGASDEAIAEAIARAVWAKWEGHLINQPGFVQPSRVMYAIGG